MWTVLLALWLFFCCSLWAVTEATHWSVNFKHITLPDMSVLLWTAAGSMWCFPLSSNLYEDCWEIQTIFVHILFQIPYLRECTDARLSKSSVSGLNTGSDMVKDTQEILIHTVHVGWLFIQFNGPLFGCCVTIPKFSIV